MKYFTTKVWLGFIIGAGLVFTTNAADEHHTKSPHTKSIHFNRIISIKDTLGRTAWTHPCSRAFSETQDEHINSWPTPPASPKDYYEVLFSKNEGAKREHTGAQFLMLVDPQNKVSQDEVRYGEPVEIWALSTNKALGWGGATNQKTIKPRKWFVNHSSRWITKFRGGIEGDYFEIFVADQAEPKTNNGQQLFTFVKLDPTTNKPNNAVKGAVEEGDVFFIKSINPVTEKGRIQTDKTLSSKDQYLWNYPSRYKKPFFETVINDGWGPKNINKNRAQEEDPQYETACKFTIDVVTKDELTNPDGKEVYDLLHTQKIVPEEIRNMRPIAGFEKGLIEDGDLEEITCGSVNGQGVVLAEEASTEKIVLYDTDSEQTKPWLELAFSDDKGAALLSGAKESEAISLSSSGDLALLTEDGSLYVADLESLAKGPNGLPLALSKDRKLIVKELPRGAGNENLKITQISCVSEKSIWGCDGKAIYHHNGTGWTKKFDGDFVAAGIDGTVVIITAEDNIRFLKSDGTLSPWVREFRVWDRETKKYTPWSPKEEGDEIDFKYVTAPDLKHVYAVDELHHVWLWNDAEKAFFQQIDKDGKPAANIGKCEFNAAGMGFLLKADGSDFSYNSFMGIKPLAPEVKKAPADPKTGAIISAAAVQPAPKVETKREAAVKANKIPPKDKKAAQAKTKAIKDKKAKTPSKKAAKKATKKTAKKAAPKKAAKAAKKAAKKAAPKKPAPKKPAPKATPKKK